MTRDEFWKLIETARAKDADEPEEGLRAALEPLTAAEVTSFQQHFDELFGSAYRWNLWGAAYQIEGGCSDDGFTDFRYGLISLGRRVFEAALKNPDSLADVDDDITNEAFGYVAGQVHEGKTKDELERTLAQPTEPVGEQWDFDDDAENARRLPRLHAKANGVGDE